MTTWDETVDFLVMGSGAGGLTGAIAAHDRGGKVLVVEKGPRYGGTSAMSGGALWVPCNPHIARLGQTDSREKALAYLAATTGGVVAPARLEAYVDSAVAMTTELERSADLRLVPLDGYPDYFDRAEGALPTGRTLGAEPLRAAPLGDALFEQREGHPQTDMLGTSLLELAHEVPRLTSRSFGARALSTTRVLRSLGRRLLAAVTARPRRETYLTMGQALMARLRLALLARGVPLWLRAPVVELVTDGARVTGAVVERAGARVRVRATRGVLLAAGGFDHSPELLAKHQRQPAKTEWSAGHALNTGDAVRLGEAVGAGFELMDSALWAPVSVVPGQELAYILAVERCLPGSLLVDRSGRRFCDESMPFPELGRLLLERGEQVIPATLVADRRFRVHYMMGAVPPALMRPDFTLPASLEGYLGRYDALRALAVARGMEPDALEATVARFNAAARRGVDEEHHRGEGLLGRFYGDAAVGPNPTMAPLERPPFYALDVWPGSLGTLGGLKVDVAGGVLRPDGGAIPGLYAAGNCASPLVGYSYPASGLTLGPAMTFAWLAARHALGRGSAG